VPVRTIQNWLDRGLISTNEAGEVDAIEVLKRDRDRQREAADRQAEKQSNPQQELMRAQAEKLKVETAIKKIQLQKLEGEIISLSEVLFDFDNALAICRSRLLALPARLALELSGMNDPKPINQLLTDCIDEALWAITEEFENYQAKVPSSTDEDEA
jgi:hypothetical protein